MPDQEQQVFKKGEFSGSIEFLNRHKLMDKVADLLMYSAYLAYSTFNPRSSIFSDPMTRRTLTRDGQTGLLAGSIVGNELYVPYLDESEELYYDSAEAGRYLGYDFRRPHRFGPDTSKFIHGRLWAFIIDEVKGREPDDYTPIGSLRPLSARHALLQNTYSLENLQEEGLIRKTTYGQAYFRVGLLSRHKEYLDLLGKTEETVYQVTPKGNGLVFIFAEEGDYKPQLETQAERTSRLGSLMPQPAY